MVFLAVALPLPARIAICLGAATFGATGIRHSFLLAGHQSVRTLAWSDEGELWAELGPARTGKAVRLANGSFRLGCLGLFLWLESCDGFHSVYIDAGKQEPAAVRRLARRLNWAPAEASGLPKPAS
jgi:hypothetical protein